MTWQARAEAISNPYWTYLIENIPNDPLLAGWGREGLYTPEAFGLEKDQYGALRRATDRASREDLVKRFAWAIPSPASLAFVAEHLDGRPVVEMGAGTGYWAWMLRQLDIDVVAYDKYPPDVAENWFHSERETADEPYTQADVDQWHARWAPLIELQERLAATTKGTEYEMPVVPPPTPPAVGQLRQIERPKEGSRRATFHQVIQGSAEVLVEHGDRALLLCWPPYGKGLAVEALMAYPGDLIVYIGEGEGGCCADDAFFELLDHQFMEEAFFHGHTQWSGIHDYITIYRRKEH